MTKGTYIGDNSKLKWKTALVIAAGSKCQRLIVPLGKVMIQADDRSTGLGLGWHEFPAEDWETEHAEGVEEVSGL